MDNSPILDQVLSEKDQMFFYGVGTAADDQNDNAWKTVSYRKKNKRRQQQPKHTAVAPENNTANNHTGKGDVFHSIHQHYEERRRKIIASQQQQLPAAGEFSSSSTTGGSKPNSSDERDSEEESAPVNQEMKKQAKARKPKRPKVTVAEAAAMLDVDHLEAYLIDITAINEMEQDVQLMRFADYFGKAFSSVNSAQFPWLKIFREATVNQMADMPFSHIPEDVYKTSVAWIGQQSQEALECFVVWLSNKIFADGQAVARRSKKVRQQLPSKSLVAIFVVLGMVLRRKPDVLINLLPILRENPQYQAEDNLPVTIWMIVQASQGDLVVGLYMWTRFLLPMLSGKSCSNSQSRELILQLVERILSSPKSRAILLSRAVRKSEHLVPPSALKLLMRITFPGSSTRNKETKRFEVVYPILKDIALSGGSERKAMEQVTREMLNVSIKATGEGVPELSREASNTFVWCLTHNPECYKQWDLLYLDNLEASVIILRKLCGELKQQSVKHSSLESLKDTLKSFRMKNAKALGKAGDGRQQASLRGVDKLCKEITGQLSKSHGYMKRLLIVSAGVSVGAAILSLNIISRNL